MKRERIPTGIWQSLPSPAVSRYLARMGWDAVFLDGQHGAISSETAYECLHVLADCGTRPYLRVSVGNPAEVERALDLGAQGVVVPMVRSVEEASAMAMAAKYPPLGRRSMGSDAAILYGSSYPDRANRQTELLLQVEHIDAVNCVEEILALPGVDGCFVGPTDLALSMGLGRAGYERAPAHRKAMRRIVAAAQAAGKAAWCNTFSIADFRAKLALGFSGLTLRSEVDLLLDSGTGLRALLRSITGAAPSRKRR